MSDFQDDFFDAMDEGFVISSYGDEQAQEDGILVPVGKKDRVTRTCWEFLAAKLGEKPPNQWPVNLMGYVMAKDGNDRALAASGALLDTWDREARRIYDENIGGGIFTLWVDVTSEGIQGVYQERDKTADEREPMTRLWFIPNELGGMTLMFPEDY